MEKRDVKELGQLRFAVVTRQNIVVSLHQHPDAAERFRITNAIADDLEVVELVSRIGYKQG